ncbi:hypothetical protein [uncultured Chitinophaga sp.]|uniref:hypothetical protein n=1 Tax=uncultured Chitinophaga sp. TaxID=339340 RepID=UPI002616111B|nr:hypothetical protein [uncultured Chitinophaga sp.]
MLSSTFSIYALSSGNSRKWDGPGSRELVKALPALVAEVRRLRAALTQIADMCECRRGDMCGSAVAHHALHGPATE